MEKINEIIEICKCSESEDSTVKEALLELPWILLRLSIFAYDDMYAGVEIKETEWTWKEELEDTLIRIKYRLTSSLQENENKNFYNARFHITMIKKIIVDRYMNRLVYAQISPFEVYSLGVKDQRSLQLSEQ